MDNPQLQNNLIFIQHFAAAIKKIPLYPPAHPLIVNSVKNIHSALVEILKTKNAVTLSLSGDNKLIVENEPVASSSFILDDVVSLFKKLNIESITFGSGIIDKEINDFLRLILLESGKIKGFDDIDKVFLDRAIRNIKVNQFSYIKVEKDSEPVVVKKEPGSLNVLKTAVNNIGRNIVPEELLEIEKQIFEAVRAEFKEKRKLSAGTRNIFKKFLLHIKAKEDVLLRLKKVLIEAGFEVQEVDNLLGDIEKEKVRRRREGIDAGVKEENEKLRKENEELKLRLSRIQEGLNEKEDFLKDTQARYKKTSDEKQRLDNVIHHMAEGLVVVDPQGNIAMANAAAEKLLNICKEDLGKPMKEIVKDEHLLTLVKDTGSTTGGALEKNVELFSPNDSTKKTLRMSSAVIEDPDGNTVGMVATLNDITKQKELENLKSNFLASVSHELRTPLVAIEKSIYLILTKAAGEISQPQAEFLSIADRNLKRLTLLINDLLDLAKLEAGKMPLKREPSSAGKIINEAAGTFDNWAKTKSINIQTKIQEDMPLLNIDPNRIIQVLNNLIGNAVKFTSPAGSITIEAGFSVEKNELEVSVLDTGIGIAKENLQKVFDKFYQAGDKSFSDISGTGMGLAISRELIELHGGKIWAESEDGRGAKFIFTLPTDTEK